MRSEESSMSGNIKETRPAVHLSVGGAAVVLIVLQGLVMYAKQGQKEVEAWADCSLPAGVTATYAEADDAVRKALFEKCERPEKATIRDSKIEVRVEDWKEDEIGREVRTLTVFIQWRPAKVGLFRWSRLDRRKTFALGTGAAADADG